MLKQSKIEVSPFVQNCRLIWDEDSKKALILDPGADGDKIIEAVHQRGLKVERIILTHAHLDHIAAAPQLRRHFGTKIWGSHRDDQIIFQHLPDQMASYGIEPIVDAFLPDHWLQEGDVIELQSFRLEVLHCPGHSPGHVVFVDRQFKRIFAGDVLFKGSVGRTDLMLGNFQDLSDSIRNKLYVLDDDFAVLPGHGPDTTLGQEKRCNPFVRV